MSATRAEDRRAASWKRRLNPNGLCLSPGCFDPASISHSRRWCATHGPILESVRRQIDQGARYDREVTPTPKPKPQAVGPSCRLAGCDAPARGPGQSCYRHRGVPDDVTVAPVQERCEVQGCSRVVKYEGRCRAHPRNPRKRSVVATARS